MAKSASSNIAGPSAQATGSSRPLVASIQDLPKLDVGRSGDANALNDLNVVESYESHLRNDPRKFMEQLLAAWSGEGWRGYHDYIVSSTSIHASSEV